MFGPRLRQPHQPWWLQGPLGLIDLLASLRFAVVVIVALAIVLAWATIVETRLGTEAVQFGFYQSWWFTVLVSLLGLSVLFSALVRLPWKRHQTGFVITHGGILVLLVGCIFSMLWGIDAQLPVFEGHSAHLAYTQAQKFSIAIRPWAGPGADRQPVESAADAKPMELAFRGGPFSWRDYSRLSVFPWWLVPRDRGIVFQGEGIELEVLDYLSDAQLEPAPPLTLRVSRDRKQWETVSFEVRGFADPHSPHRTFGMGSRQELPGGERIVFWVAGSRAETEAFRRTVPQGALSAEGQVVFYQAGQVYRFSVEELRKPSGVRLGDTPLRVRYRQFNPRFLGLVFDVLAEPTQGLISRSQPERSLPHRLFLFADMVEFNRPVEEYGLFGSFWYAVTEPDASGRGAAGTERGDAGARAEATGGAEGGQSILKPHLPRLDVMQGVDGHLYYRAWSRGKLQEVGILPADGAVVEVFRESGQPLYVGVEEFVPHDRPGVLLRAAPFGPKSRMAATRPFARVRLTVDGHSEETWLEAMPASPLVERPEPGQELTVAGRERCVSLTLQPQAIELGFSLFLHEFERKLDPGSSAPASYGSRVDVLDRQDSGRALARNIWISMNRPINVADPKTGRTYRVYQEAFRGPFRPGEPIFEQLVRGRTPTQELYLSWLTINYDPGRGLKYLGALLIVLGIACMFYMKAYFFAPRRKQKEEAVPAKTESREAAVPQVPATVR